MCSNWCSFVAGQSTTQHTAHNASHSASSRTPSQHSGLCLLSSPFPCPVLNQDEQLRSLGIFLSASKRPENPWHAKIPKITARLKLWERLGLSLLARANVAAMMIASCARYHASCAVASEDAIKNLHTMLRNFVWSGHPDKLGSRLVSAETASVPVRFGGIGLPNFQAIHDAHHLRFWAQAMCSNEDWAWALRHDAAAALCAAGLSHPLDKLNKRVSLPCNTLGAVIITTLRKRLGKRFRFREVDLLGLSVEEKQRLINLFPQFCPKDPSEPLDYPPLERNLAKVPEPLEDEGFALIRSRPPFVQCDTFLDGDPIGLNARQNTGSLQQQQQQQRQQQLQQHHEEDNDDDDDVLRDILNDSQAFLEEQQRQQRRREQQQQQQHQQ